MPEGAPSDTYSLIQLAHERAKKPFDGAVFAEKKLDPIWDVGLLTSTTGTTGLPKLVLVIR